MLNQPKFVIFLLIQISTSGLISFRNPFTSEDVDPFPLSQSIIAPFWANLNVNPLFGGAIFYNVVENGSLLTTFNNEVIRFNSEFQGFRAKFAVTITWHNVALYDSGNPPIMVSAIMKLIILYTKQLSDYSL